MKSSVYSSFLLVAIAAASLTGCSAMKHVFTADQAAADERAEMKKRDDAAADAAIAKVPDGDCAGAEQCREYCLAIGRALDCFKTGKAALLGVDVHSAGNYRVESSGGDSDDSQVKYEEESTEHQSLLPLAREAFGKACTANHAESCRRSGELADKKKPAEGHAFYERACVLHDQPACDKLAKSK